MRSLRTGLTPEQIAELENIARSDAGKFLISQLCVRIDHELELNEGSAESLAQFEVPNWELKQAYMMGYRKALKDVHKQVCDIQKSTKDTKQVV